MSIIYLKTIPTEIKFEISDIELTLNDKGDIVMKDRSETVYLYLQCVDDFVNAVRDLERISLKKNHSPLNNNTL